MPGSRRGYTVQMLPKTWHTIGHLAAALICLFPPFRSGTQQSYTVAVGYHFFFTPPNDACQIDVGALAAQLVLLLILVNFAKSLAGDRT